MKLTEEQEKKVQQYVDAQGLKRTTLRDDVVDHLCCVLEHETGKGKPFEQSLHRAVNELAPRGLKNLERQTLFSLNAKRIIRMKKLLYLTGLIGSVTLTIGVTLTLLSMPGGNRFFMIGFLTLLLVFIPLLALDRYKVAISSTPERLQIVLGVIAAVTTGLSGLFKVLHLQGAPWLLLLGAFIFAVGFLPFFFFSMYRKSVSRKIGE